MLIPIAGPTGLASAPVLHVEHYPFHDLASFQTFAQAHHRNWHTQVQNSLRLIALHGIVDPLTAESVPASDLSLNGSNFRETLHHNGCISRHRAVLLMMQIMLEAGALPPRNSLRIYCPERITPFADLLQNHFPGATCTEFLPDPTDPRRTTLPHQDLCTLTYADNSFDLLICNDLFEHIYDLNAAFEQCARVLRPGGWLVATFPMLYGQAASQIKARHRPGAMPGVAAEADLLMDPEFHDNPLEPDLGSLVYQLPGWDLLDQVRAAGLQEPCLHWLAAPSYGVVGAEIPAVLVFTALGAGVEP